jgi:hypothetical protein
MKNIGFTFDLRFKNRLSCLSISRVLSLTFLIPSLSSSAKRGRERKEDGERRRRNDVRPVGLMVAAERWRWGGGGGEFLCAMRLYTCPFPRTCIPSQAWSRHSGGPTAQDHFEHLSNSHATISFQLLRELVAIERDHRKVETHWEIKHSKCAENFLQGLYHLYDWLLYFSPMCKRNKLHLISAS